MKYLSHKDGDWIKPVMDDYRLACCDCGLIHRVDFLVRGKRVWFRATRDKRATAQRRRRNAPVIVR